MAVRLEDGRQRHPADGAGDLTAAMLRGIVRASPETRFLVTHADRDLIEQVMYGSTAEEQAQLLWDICWIWGPPMDDLAHLVAAFGASRFAFGTGFPLRLAESAIAKLDLLACTLADRSLIEGGNAARMHR
jgi:predicted TIM-barrel fold metal-dependent hydrolase